MKVSKKLVSEHRTSIMTAAASLFRQRGFNDVTVAEVMVAAGLTHGAFYRHFSSKQRSLQNQLVTGCRKLQILPNPVALQRNSPTAI